MARGRKAGFWFGATLSCYLAYWLAVVPLIEPTLDEEVRTGVTEAEVGAARDKLSNRRGDIAQYFPEGAWELDTPSIWQSDQTRLLFKTLHSLSADTVELKPCTVLIFPKGSTPDSPSGQPIIMRAVAGARVRFDGPVDLKNVDLTKRQLVGGTLSGPITIYRSPSQPGANDDLEITTHDVEMLGERIFTPNPVQFRLGRNHGSGRDMEILMATAEGAKGPNLKTGAIRSLELKRDVRMQLELANGPLAAGGPPRKRDRAEPPIQITCQGSFLFELARYAASFHNQVNVIRLNEVGESDQLNCEVLTTYFESRAGKPAEPATPPPAPGETSGVHVSRIEARGDPVVLRSPARAIFVRCRGLDYMPGPSGAIGSMVALGPGVLQGKLPNERGNYDAKWGLEFRFEPAEGTQHRAALVGAAEVRFPEVGTIQADELFAWLSPKIAPPANPPTTTPNSSGWELDRVLAGKHQDKNLQSRGDVVIDSPQLHGITGQLEAHVERPQLAAAGAASAPPGGAPAAQQSGQPAAKSPRARQTPTQRYDLRGGRIRLDLVPEVEQLALSAVTVEQRARLHEASPVKPGEGPLKVEGDRLHVAGANTTATRVTVNGRPGYLEAGGMTLRGAAIEMDKHASRLWINGTGQMTMPIDQDLNGQPVAHRQNLDITWKGGMNFQGNSVVFERAVLVRTDAQSLETEKMEAVFDRTVDFNRPNGDAGGQPAERPQLAFVRCFGRAFLKSRMVDERGQQTSIDNLDALDLTVNKLTGDVTGAGPGTVTHVGRGNEGMARGGAGGGDKPRVERPARSESELTYLNVQFRTALAGNLNRRAMRFGKPVKAVYGPVPDWNTRLNADDPASLGRQGIVLDSQELEVLEMPAPGKRDRGWFELTAHGNVVAEGAQFTARGDRLTYSEQKDQLVLHGDALSPAEFFQDTPSGERRASRADELTYWFTLQRVQVNSFQSFDMQVPNNTPPKPPKKGMLFK